MSRKGLRFDVDRAEGIAAAFDIEAVGFRAAARAVRAGVGGARLEALVFDCEADRREQAAMALRMAAKSKRAARGGR